LDPGSRPLENAAWARRGAETEDESFHSLECGYQGFGFVSNKFSDRGLLTKVDTWPFQSGMILKRSSVGLALCWGGLYYVSKAALKLKIDEW
jgi:hypothetical protein